MTAKGYTGLSDAAERHVVFLEREGLASDFSREKVEAIARAERNRAIASIRGRLSRLPRLDASPECVAVADLVRMLDEMEAVA